MNKINSYAQLQDLYEKYSLDLEIREDTKTEKEAQSCNRFLTICGGTGCKSSESDKILENLKNEIEKAGLSDRVTVSITGCFGFCEKGPIVKVSPDDTFYVSVK
ncbi:MAG: (2Fe-2S) ferredoxin domain-containing protein, partial [Clostridium sp.]|nr:(2Fe-2S) ferredoxin domain-containing protein [Clostridium sp.]